MSFLLDTSALSELTRDKPNSGLVAWMKNASAHNTFISVLTVAEISVGIEMLAPSRKRRSLESWFTKLLDGFHDRILDFDLPVAREWSLLQAHARRSHRSLPIVDGQLAATAVAHDLTVVTRNERHFQMPGYGRLRTINPWT